MAAEIRGGDHVDTWRRAREMVDRVGRWPLVYWNTRDWDELVTGEFFARIQFEYSDRGSDITADTSLLGLLARADALDFEAVLEAQEAQDWKRKYLDTDLAEALTNAEQRWGRAPAESDLRRAAVASRDHMLGIERFLFAWELAQGLPAATTREVTWALERMQPSNPPDDPWFVLLLPTANPWEVYAHVEGLWNHPADRLIRAARGWHERFGAECTTIFAGSSTQLHVRQPPTDSEIAWELAREHWLLARDTFVLPGTRIRDYTWALMSSSWWDLWSKP